MGPLLAACTESNPNRPTPAAPPVPAPAPAPAPAPSQTTFREPYTEIALGETVTALVSADDPRCGGWPEWPCKFFRVTPPHDGTLDVELKNVGGNLDLSVEDREGREWWYPISVRVSAGRTYQITIWEYEFPGLEFHLRTSMRPD